MSIVVLVAASALAAVASWFVPVPEALASAGRHTALFAAVAAGALVGVLGALVRLSVARSRPGISLLLAGAALLLGATAFLVAGRVERACTARYDGGAVVIGTTLTPRGVTYRQREADLSVDDVLFDAAGKADIVWTSESIARCRVLVSGSYFLWLPLLVASLLAAVHGRAGAARLWLPSISRTTPTATSHQPAREHPLRYDAFISYRHGGRDAEVARTLLQALSDEGYAVAIDSRDFPANESFLAEMERCIRQSRFTLALISERYLASGNCDQEAMISKVLDMGERRRRLIPIYLEAVDVPVWLHGIVGIRLDEGDPQVEPLAKLVATLGTPLARQPHSIEPG